MALSRLSPCLVICDDEASAIRMTGDINEMAGEQLACVFPAKDLNFAYMEGVSREYEHKRLEALSYHSGQMQDNRRKYGSLLAGNYSAG